MPVSSTMALAAGSARCSRGKGAPAVLRCMSPLLGQFSDLSPQSGPKRTLMIQIAVTNRDFMSTRPSHFRHGLLGNDEIDCILAPENLEGFLTRISLEDGVSEVFEHGARIHQDHGVIILVASLRWICGVDHDVRRWHTLRRPPPHRALAIRASAPPAGLASRIGLTACGTSPPGPGHPEPTRGPTSRLWPLAEPGWKASIQNNSGRPQDLPQTRW